MGRYSVERREYVVRQMMPPGTRTVTELAEETGISTMALHAWREQARAAGAISSTLHESLFTGQNPASEGPRAMLRALGR